MHRTNITRRIAAGTVLVSILLIGYVYTYHGWYGIHAVFRRGLNRWVDVTADDSRLSPSMRVALTTPAIQVQAGPLSWKAIGTGFDVAELSVLAGGKVVDRILLARVDPTNFRFEVHTAAHGEKELDDWMQTLGATLVINGSYFAPRGMPATPVLSDGQLIGPQTYEANHGAFVASDEFTGIVDLAQGDWHKAFATAHDALVSYPLLLAADGSSRSDTSARWLANRSFIAQDNSGRMILGTTREAFFSIDRLAAFLRQSPLELTLALNLDGGPVACQAIAWKGFRRNFCGDWELNTERDQLKLLQPAFGSSRFALPIVIAVRPKV